MRKKLPFGIYGITVEEYSLGRSNIEVVKSMVKSGIRIIQYREKGNKTLRQKFLECKKIREITKRKKVLFIVNDHIDIAKIVRADGVHLGQDDLPVREARKMFNGIIGLSTHSPEQAKKAVKDGADYIGVGPIFPTRTKKDCIEAVGLEYLEYVVKNIRIPFVAIGGIKEHNIHKVINCGAKTIALVTEITCCKDVPLKIETLFSKFPSKLSRT